MAILYEALWELIDVTLHTTHVWVEKVRHHTNPVLHALLMISVPECAGGVCVQWWRCFRCMSVTSLPVAHGVMKSSVLSHIKDTCTCKHTLHYYMSCYSDNKIMLNWTLHATLLHKTHASHLSHTITMFHWNRVHHIAQNVYFPHLLCILLLLYIL